MDTAGVRRPHSIVGLVIAHELVEELGLDPSLLLPLIYETLQETIPHNVSIVVYDEATEDYIIVVAHMTEAEKVKKGLLEYLIARVYATVNTVKYGEIQDLVYIQTTLS